MKRYAAIALAIILIISSCYAIAAPFSGNSDNYGEISVADITVIREFIVNNRQLGIAEQTEFDITNVILMRLKVNKENDVLTLDYESFSLGEVPEFSGEPHYTVNNGVPFFKVSDLTVNSYEHYDELDKLGRCGVTAACIGVDLMPTEERGEIGMIKPSGWNFGKYDFIDGKYLYNRCHLIGFQLTGENANEKNLITGTRFMNVQGMLGLENKVAEYIKKTKKHVLYRVTPIFDGENLLANGVLMEAYSVEDNGRGICFNEFCYNAQPDVIIDYKTGESRISDNVTTTIITTTTTTTTTTTQTTAQISATDVLSETESTFSAFDEEADYIINTSSMKIHKPTCRSVSTIADHNKRSYTGDISDLISIGYSPCKKCNPT